MVVVDDFDEGLYFAALVLAGFRHAAGDLERVALDTGDECVWEGMRFAAVVLGLDDDYFLSCISSARNDRLNLWLDVLLSGLIGLPYHSADLEDYTIVSTCIAIAS